MQKNNVKVKTKMIQFTFMAGEAEKVSLVGDFNNWNPDADPMEKDEYGTWTKTKMLSSGDVEYKFYVDGQWLPDPNNTSVCMNCYGSLNNIAKIVIR